MKKVISILLALAMVFGVSAMAFADTSVTTNGGTGSVPVNLTVTAATFSATVPASIAISVAANGTVTCPTTAKIYNTSAGPIKVSAISVTGKNGWSHVAWDANSLSGEKVGTKKFALKIQNADTKSAAATSASNIGSIAASGNVTLNLAAQIAPQAAALASTNICDVVFTLAWDTL